MGKYSPYTLKHPHNSPEFLTDYAQHLFARVTNPEKCLGNNGRQFIEITDEDCQRFPQLYGMESAAFCYMLGNAGGWQVEWLPKESVTNRTILFDSLTEWQTAVAQRAEAALQIVRQQKHLDELREQFHRRYI